MAIVYDMVSCEFMGDEPADKSLHTSISHDYTFEAELRLETVDTRREEISLPADLAFQFFLGSADN